jgi:hypothetical protein
VSLSSCDFLTHIQATKSGLAGCSKTLAIEDYSGRGPGRRGRSAPSGPAWLRAGRSGSRPSKGQIVWHRPSCPAGADDVEDAVDEAAPRVLPRSPTLAERATEGAGAG